MKRKIRLVLFLVIAVVLAALIIQNHQPAQIQVLFVKLQMPLILLLTLTSGLGFLLGVLTTFFGRNKPNK